MKSIFKYVKLKQPINEYWLIQLLLFTLLVLLPCGEFAWAQKFTENTFIVSNDGSDNNPGTVSKPMATLEAARNVARKSKVVNPQIIIMPGDYYLSSPLELDSRDNGLTIKTYKNKEVTLYGGKLITNWYRHENKFWSANLKEVKEGIWDFRALVINGRLAKRSRMPDSGKYRHLSSFDVPWLTGVGGGWARKPTKKELTTMRYKLKDIPELLDVQNAEVRVYHMWDASFVGVKRNDINNHKLIFSNETIHPPGAFGKKGYVIFNTSEGMTKPGEWYLDRRNGRLVYWPMEGEDMEKVKVIAPTMERIIRIEGDSDKKAKNITIRGVTLQATNVPLKSAGFGASAFNGALSMKNTKQCIIDSIEILNASGFGITAAKTTDCQIINCHIHNLGGAGAKISGGTNLLFKSNHIHDVGIYYSNATGLYVSKGNLHKIYRNEIHNVPYSGIIIGGAENLVVEENLIYRVMREMQDGGAIYASGVSNCIIRGNIVRDIEQVGEGYGVSSYYLDEGAHDCTVEQNVSINVDRPTHNHIARNSIIRNNVFINDEDLTLSFQRSANLEFIDNTLYTPGRIRITRPNAIITWKGNKIFYSGGDKNKAYLINSEMPHTPKPAQKDKPIEVKRSMKPPKIDGNLAMGEWLGSFQHLNRMPSRRPSSGAPVLSKFSWDNEFLYIGAIIPMFNKDNINLGNSWEKDDAVEISLGGYYKGDSVTYVIRSYVNGSIQSITDAGVSDTAAQKLEKRVRYVSKIMEKSNKEGWVGEWAIPLKLLGLNPKSDLKIPFNMCAFVNEYDCWHCWEGTLGETWEVDKAGMLHFK